MEEDQVTVVEENQITVVTYSDGRIKKYDKNGNIIYFKDKYGYNDYIDSKYVLRPYEHEYEYDENGNLIRYHSYVKRHSDSGWYKLAEVIETFEYDENGNKTYENSNGYQQWWEYDDNGRVIKYSSKYGSNERSETYTYSTETE